MKLLSSYTAAVVPSILMCCLNISVANPEERIKQARSAAPPSVSADATIVDGGEVLVEGSNGWTCMPDTMPGDNAPVCVDDVWKDMMQALSNKEDFSTDRVGISYMLQGDSGAGVSNATPYHPNPKEAEDYTETGPHLMIIVPKEYLKGITDDPSQGGPYVMWGETPYAHIMIPVEDN
ncbi:hypothetical protein [Kangiella sediminilitoris]|uniref:Secreted protein n=1 Tax=Kangiella sediminilitoris TaxID=1144748 RepID=A0A1B3B9H6_9GAMM|nr:hypothetical protein [Kangiella sediminilitoris]AOE49440.1 hypothetical protein KS2013_716 [Kangiella sediminilitoris]